MRRIIVATPAYDGRVDVWFANSLFYTLKSAGPDIEIIPIFLAYDALIQRARDSLVSIAVEAGADDIFWIDSDVEWEPAWFYRFLNYPVDVVGAPCPKKSDIEQYNVKVEGTSIPIHPTGLLEVDGVGTGFLRMSKRAYMALWDSSLEYVSDGCRARSVFEVKIENGEMIGEDITLCKKLRSLGIPIYVDKTVTCNHNGQKKYIGNFQKFLERLAE